MEKVTLVSLKQIIPDPNQPRQEYEVSAMQRLEKSIKAQGIMVPLAVEKIAGTNTYLLVDGERRYRASTAVGLKEVPVMVYESMDEKERIMTRFHLQEQHSNWSAFDKARAIATLQNNTEMSSQEIADLLGLNYKTVQDYLLLLSLSKRTMTTANTAKIPYSYLSEIAAAKRSCKEVTLRNQLEDSLVEKVKTGVIQRASEIRKYRLAIEATDEAGVKKIIASPNLTAEAVLTYAKLDTKLEKTRVIQLARTLANQLERGIEKNIASGMTAEDAASIERLKEVLERFTS